MRIAIGHSDDPDGTEAIREAIAQIEEKLGGATPAGALLYTCIDIDHQSILDGVQERWPGLPLIGCTTDGECSSVLQFTEDSVVLTVFVGEDLDLRVGVGTDVREDVDGAVRDAFAQLASYDAPPSLVIALPESLGVSGAAVVAAMNRQLPQGSVLVGGTAGDQLRLTDTRQFFGDRVLQGAVPLMTFGPGLEVSVGVASGWAPIGRPGIITRVDGSTVLEIDGEPALSFLRSNIGWQATADPEFPFAVYEDDTDAFYLRAPLGSNDDGHIIFAGDVPEGATVRVTEAGRDQILAGARQAARAAADGFSGEPSALLVFSCAARKQVLGTRCAEELGLLQSALAKPIDAAGFYTYGEIAPLRRRARSSFHNETVVAAFVGSRCPTQTS